MKPVILATATLLVCTGVAQAAHPERMASAAHRLDESAQHFDAQLRDSYRDRHTAREAAIFAKTARHFHRQVEHGRSHHHLWDDYQSLARRFYGLQTQFDYPHHAHRHRHGAVDFRAVAHAFEDLRRLMQANRYTYRYRYRDRHWYGYRDRYRQRHPHRRHHWRHRVRHHYCSDHGFRCRAY